jgi:hypothetical protein
MLDRTPVPAERPGVAHLVPAGPRGQHWAERTCAPLGGTHVCAAVLASDGRPGPVESRRTPVEAGPDAGGRARRARGQAPCEEDGMNRRRSA